MLYLSSRKKSVQQSRRRQGTHTHKHTDRGVMAINDNDTHSDGCLTSLTWRQFRSGSRSGVVALTYKTLHCLECHLTITVVFRMCMFSLIH